MKKKWSVLFVILVVVTGCSAPTTTAVTTVTATPTLISTPTLTLTPIPTIEPTSTPIPTPTPIFPASYEAFEKEVKENCAIPPQDTIAELENLALNSSAYQKSPESIKEAAKWGAMFIQMMLWLGRTTTEEENFVVGVDVYPFIDADNWYCVGAILFPPAPIGKSPEEYYQELVPLLSEDWWWKWEYPITLSYWSNKGLVVYNYEPATMPAP